MSPSREGCEHNVWCSEVKKHQQLSFHRFKNQISCSGAAVIGKASACLRNVHPHTSVKNIQNSSPGLGKKFWPAVHLNKVELTPRCWLFQVWGIEESPLSPHAVSAFTQKTSQTVKTFDLIADAKARLNV